MTPRITPLEQDLKKLEKKYGKKGSWRNELQKHLDYYNKPNRKINFEKVGDGLRMKSIFLNTIKEDIALFDSEFNNPLYYPPKKVTRKEAERELLRMAGVSDEKIVLMSKFSPVPYAEKILKKDKFLYDKYKRFWRYDTKEGIYCEDADIYIKQKLRKILLGEEQQKNQYVNEIVSYIKELNYDPYFKIKINPNLIPFQNCLFNLRTGEQIPFSQNYFVTKKIPQVLDPKYKECKRIDNFFKEIVGEGNKIMLYDLASYCLYGDGYPYQKIFFIFGGGNNGKTTYDELLRKFLGEENVSSVPPHDICGANKFSTGGVWGKLANISNDISYKALDNINKLKELTGEDTVTIERKYCNPFEAKLFAKQIYSTNQLPIINDKTHALNRRLYLIEFPYQIPKNKVDPLLLQKLTTPEELSGLTWVCINNLKKIAKNNFIFHLDPDIDKITELYEDLSDPLNKFIKENCVEDAEGHIFKFDFKEHFQNWLKSNRFRLWSDTEIGTQMKKRYEDGKKSYYENQQYRAWLGISWKSQKRQGRQGRQGLFISPYIYESNKKGVDSLPTLSLSIKLCPICSSDNTNHYKNGLFCFNCKRIVQKNEKSN